jgi:hypothetical protein
MLSRNNGPAHSPHNPISAPWRASLAAAGTTGLFALAGRSRPGTFLKAAAFFGVGELSWSAAKLYGRQQMNRGVFNMDKLEPKPGKLWERTKHWTTEDAALSGGALGIFMAMTPRAMPGAHGFSRFVGAATVGCAIGFKVGQALLVRIPPQLLSMIETSDTMVRHKAYEKLQQNNEAKAGLSRVGKFALSVHTSPYLRIVRLGGMGGMGGAQQQGPPGLRPITGLKAEPDARITVEVEYKKDELAGPDLEQGHRVYKDDINSWDASSIQNWLERVQELEKNIAPELQYLWRRLAERERDFYKVVEEDSEKDIFRRELQLLNSLAADLVARHAILGYYASDAQKRLLQVEQTDSTIPSYESPQLPATTAQQTHYGPHIITERVRTSWSNKKEALGHIEYQLQQLKALQLEEGTPGAEQRNVLEKNVESLRKNIEATERVLRCFEEDIRKADEQGKR